MFDESNGYYSESVDHEWIQKKRRMKNMKRMGKLSGKIYSDDEIKNMPECGIPLTDEQANDHEYIQTIHKAKSKDCEFCRGCPLYNVLNSMKGE